MLRFPASREVGCGRAVAEASAPEDSNHWRRERRSGGTRSIIATRHWWGGPPGQSLCCGQMPPQKVTSLVRSRPPGRLLAHDPAKADEGVGRGPGVRPTEAVSRRNPCYESHIFLLTPACKRCIV